MVLKYLKYKCPAKLNLTLDIKSRREDGYHEIDSLVSLISLSDEIEIILGDTGIEFISSLPNFSLDNKQNTVYQAREYFKEKILEAIKIKVYKNIPLQSGLGGGSSNAALVLQTLNNFSANPYTQEELNQIAFKIGSDVPLFLKRGKYFRVRGRGEIIEEVNLKQNLYLIIILTAIKVSTPLAYRTWDELNLDYTNFTEQFLWSGDIKHLNNAFWGVLEKISPALIQLRKDLLLMGAPAVGISGTGGTLFLPFSCPRARDQFIKKLKNSPIFKQTTFFRENLLKLFQANKSNI